MTSWCAAKAFVAFAQARKLCGTPWSFFFLFLRGQVVAGWEVEGNLEGCLANAIFLSRFS